MFGRRTSCTYAAPPVNFFGMSRRAMLLPTHRCSAGSLGFTCAVASRLRSVSRARSQYVTPVPLGRRRTELHRRGRNQDVARFGAREAKRGAAVLDREAAGGLTLVRGARGVAADDLDALEVHVQLVGGDLRQRGADALAQLDLAGEDRHGAVRVDAKP